MGEPRRIQALARLEEIHLYGYTIFDAVEHNMELFSRSIKLEQLEFGKFEVRFYDEAHIQSILPAFFTALSFPRTQADYKLSWMKLPPLKPGPHAYTVSSSELVLECLECDTVRLLMEHLDLEEKTILTLDRSSIDDVKICQPGPLILRDVEGDLVLPLYNWYGDDLDVQALMITSSAPWERRAFLRSQSICVTLFLSAVYAIWLEGGCTTAAYGIQ